MSIKKPVTTQTVQVNNTLVAVLRQLLTDLLRKIISFKNLIFAAATIIGIKVLMEMITVSTTGSDIVHLFKIWAVYQMLLLILFYTTNQVQKWIFTRTLPGNVHSDDFGKDENEESGHHGGGYHNTEEEPGEAGNQEI